MLRIGSKGRLRTSYKWIIGITLLGFSFVVFLIVFWTAMKPDHRDPSIRIGKRVRRNHDNTIREEYKDLTKRIGPFHTPNETLHSRREAEADLDELEWIIENRFSYRDLKGFDYRAGLDTIRSALGDGISHGDFAYQLMKFMTLFGDGHSKLRSSHASLGSLNSGFSPFLVEESSGRLVAFEGDRSGFLDPDHPYLRKMDGLPIAAWVEAASQWVAQGSPQFVRCRSIRNLRLVGCLRKELGLENSGPLEVELESEDGSSSKTIEVPLADRGSLYGDWPRNESRILPGNIGYLRILPWMKPDAEFQEKLIEWMNQFRDTHGLVIDIRTNSGGSRAPLRTLFPFFMADDDPPRVMNVAAYRLGVKDRKGAFEKRFLYRADSRRWSEAERTAIKRFAVTFQPKWAPPAGEFSEWHYFVISPTRKQGTFYYGKPVVVLMDPKNFSACDIFLGAFKGWKNVTLMGQPSGGGSGCYVEYRLHHSLLSVSFSSMASFRPNGQPYDGKGIQPDVLVEPVATDFIGETDTILDAAIQWLSGRTG